METPQERPEEGRAPRPPEAPARDVPTGGTNRVLDEGTSQELVIINYADDALLGARDRARKAAHEATGDRERPRGSHDLGGDRELDLDLDVTPGGPEAAPARVADPGPDSEEAPEAPRAAAPEADDSAGTPGENPDASLVIVRDADFVMMSMEADSRTVRPPVVPPPTPRPPIPPATPPPAVEAPELELIPREPMPSQAPPAARAPSRVEAPPAPAEETGPRFFEPGAADPGARRDLTTRRPASRVASRAGIPPVASRVAAKPEEPRLPGDDKPAETASSASAIRKREPIWARAPKLSWLLFLAGIAAFAGGTALSILQVEPFHTWYYLFAWYPFLLVVNHLTAMRAGELSILSGRVKPLAALAAWSVPVWLTFEVLNFRLEDWYYVGVPHAWIARRLGVILSFATVLPGMFLVEELLRHRGAFRYSRSKPFALDAKRGVRIQQAGLGLTALVLALPTFLFPLVWILPALLLEPWLARRRQPSLLADLASGKPGRIYRLLVAGMICGLFWEAANSIAGGKWIYTVPGLTTGKLFEMPFVGFIGFAPFALACTSMARALVAVGLLPEWEVLRPRLARAAQAAAAKAAAGATGSAEAAAPAASPADSSTSTEAPEPDAATDDGATPPARAIGPTAGVRLSLCAWAVLGSFLVLEGMDRWTVDSVVARPEDVPGIPDGVAQYAHQHGKDDLRGLVELIDAGALHVPGASSEATVAALRDKCRLAMLRGLGTDNVRRLDAVGVHSVEDLAARDPVALAKALRGVESGWWPRPRRVAVWVEAARRAS